MTTFLLFLLPIAAASGWFAAKKHYFAIPSTKNGHFNNYIVGLNYLLNEQPDKAVDVFIKMLEVDSETVETHQALGALFRRRGEVGRAIRIHQNLIARPQLSRQQRTEALLALGQDYLRSGMLDRAERLFLETVEMDSGHKAVALRHLLDIYQQLKRWEAAIQIANKLVVMGDTMQSYIAHYYCELAQEARTRAELGPALEYLKNALNADPRCTRANLLLGDIELKADNVKAATKAYQQIKNQDDAFVTETLAPLMQCFEKSAAPEELLKYLQDILPQNPRISIVLTIANFIQQQQGVSAAANYIADQLRQRPSLRGLQQLIVLHLHNAKDEARANLLILQDLTSNLLKNKPIYRCVQCGFSCKTLQWLCPSCKSWSTVKPIQGLEGE